MTSRATATTPATVTASRTAAAPPLDASLGDKLVSAALWGAGASFLAPTMGTMMALQTILPSDRLEWLNRFYCWGQVALTGATWRAIVDPAVDPSTPYVFCQNHTNHFDHCVLYRATPHFKQGLEAADHFRYPVYGWFMRQRGTIAVERRGKRQLEMLREGFRRERDKGHSILAFPEGTRARDGRVGKFKAGVFQVARELGMAVVPVAVTGMYDVMRAGSWIIRPGQDVTVWVDAPIETKDVGPDGVYDLANRCRAAVARRVDAWWDAKAAR